MEFFDSCHGEKVRSCDSDCNNNAGELIIKISKDAYMSATWGEYSTCEVKDSVPLTRVIELVRGCLGQALLGSGVLANKLFVTVHALLAST